MSINRFNAMRDRNELDICGYLDDLSIPHWKLSGTGIPDIMILHQGNFKLLEVKSRKGRLTPPQAEFFELARQHNAKHLFVVRDLEELLEALEEA